MEISTDETRVRENLRAGNCATPKYTSGKLASASPVREGSSKDAIDSREMEAAPRRHNITILGRPPRARGGRRRGREAGLTPFILRSLAGRRRGGVFEAGSRGRGVGTPGVCALRRRLCGYRLCLCRIHVTRLCPSRESSLLCRTRPFSPCLLLVPA